MRLQSFCRLTLNAHSSPPLGELFLYILHTKLLVRSPIYQTSKPNQLYALNVFKTFNNDNLHEGPLPASEYNRLPHIDDMKMAAVNNSKSHAILLGIIAAHGLADHYSIHLVHKHFDIPDGRVMVYESVRGRTHGDFILSSARVPGTCRNLHGLYFKAALDGKMVA